MAKVTYTYEKARELQQLANNYINFQIKNELKRLKKDKPDEEFDPLRIPLNKLCGKIKLLGKQFEKMNAEIEEKTEQLRIDHCALEKDMGIANSNVIAQEKDGRYRYTKDGQTDFNKALKKLIEEQTYSFDDRICNDVPSDLTEEEYDAFEGILIPANIEVPAQPIPTTQEA